MRKNLPSVAAYRARVFLLTRNEREFFHALLGALDDHWQLFAKVRLADVVTCPDSEWDRDTGRRIAQKHLDFVVCHRASLRIVAAIELDDRSHARPERRRRDLFLNRVFRKAGIPLLRYRARLAYQPEEIKAFWRTSGPAKSFRSFGPARRPGFRPHHRRPR